MNLDDAIRARVREIFESHGRLDALELADNVYEGSAYLKDNGILWVKFSPKKFEMYTRTFVPLSGPMDLDSL